jgi:hypothetical protein
MVVDPAVLVVDDDVFQNGSEAKCSIDIRLGLRREIDSLGVATTLNIEDSRVGPAVLVVPDQKALWICREGGLARS